MRRPKILWGITIIIAWAIIGCSNQQTHSNETKSTQPKKNEARVQKPKDMMNLAFTYPIITVNGARAQKKENEYQERIEVQFPQNSIHDISLVIIGTDGEEQTLRGKIDVRSYTKYSKPEGENPELVWVTPKNPEYVYGNILQHGYGELTVREGLRNEETGETMGPVMVKLILGTKKKIDDKQIEFRFRESAAQSVNGRPAPVELSFSQNSTHNLQLVIGDEYEGNVRLHGELQVFERSFYTDLSPVWISIPQEVKEALRKRGGKAELAMSVPSTASELEEYVRMVDDGENTTVTAKQHGKLVATLKLRRDRQ